MAISFVDFLKNLISMPNFFIVTVLISGVMFINGLSDVPNSIATCVSTRCMTPKKALIMVAILNSLGVFVMTLISSQVAETIFHLVNFGDNTMYSLTALCCALVAIVLWSFVAWYFGIPSSQSHALIAGISGAAISLRGDLSGIDFGEWKKVLYGLFIINALAFVLGFAITKIIERICKNIDRRKTNKFFTGSEVFAAASMSFMNGAQDGQKFMGIFLLGLVLSSGATTASSLSIPLWLCTYCATLMILGAFIGGIRIIKTVGTKVVKLEKYQGTAADLSSAICLCISTALGIPVSTTHSKNCAVMGVGASKRISNVNWTVAKNMLLTWIITFPGCGFLGYILTKIVLNFI